MGSCNGLAATLLGVLSALLHIGSANADALPTLHTIRQVHLLTTQQASRRYPVHIRGVITYYDPFLNHPRRPIIMVTDATATIYVAIPGETTMPLHPGTLLDVVGVSGPGDFAPTIDDARITMLGNAPLPANPPHETLTHMLTGVVDAQWSELEGIVESVEYSGSNVTLKLQLEDGEVAATTVLQSGVNYDRLVDARIRIRGVAGSLFTRNRQIIGVQLLFPGIQSVQVMESAPSDPLMLPISPVSRLMTYVPGESIRHRVHLRGVITLFWPGRLLCMQDDERSLCAGTVQADPLAPGTTVDVTGFPTIGNVTPTLSDATYRAVKAGAPVAPVDPIPVSADEALSGQQDARLVRIDGRVLAIDRAAADPTVVLQAGRLTFQIVMAASQGAATLAELQEGSIVRVTGICSVRANAKVFTRHDGYPVTQSFQILLRRVQDVSVVRKPSWFTIRHTLYLLAGALVLTLLALAWAVLLRHRIKQQAEQLRHQATHDALTGLRNRRSILEMLRLCWDAEGRESSSMGVMMLDADHFKRINDTYGHLTGDEVLRTIAHRILRTLRPHDLAGRWGGEEFLIVIPRCTAEELAERAAEILAAIGTEPMQTAHCSLAVTASIGTAISHCYPAHPHDGLAAADKALYRAKSAGRNRVIDASSPVDETQAAAGSPPNERRSISKIRASYAAHA